MRRRWVRRAPERKDDVGALMAAGIVAAGVGAVTYYLARLIFARDPVNEHRHSVVTTDAPGREDVGRA
jgi:hypothetical protein